MLSSFCKQPLPVWPLEMNYDFIILFIFIFATHNVASYADVVRLGTCSSPRWEECVTSLRMSAWEATHNELQAGLKKR